MKGDCKAICLFTFLSTFFTHALSAQFGIYVKDIALTNTTDLHIKGNVAFSGNANMANGGNLFISGDLSNNASNKLFLTKSGKVIFSGTGTQQISAGDSLITFNKVVINKSGGEILLSQSIRILDTLGMISGNLQLVNHHLDLGKTGYLSGENDHSHVMASSGKVKAMRFISNSQNMGNVAGMGLTLKIVSGSLGYTTIERGYQSQAAGDSSIHRYFMVTPSVSGMIDTLHVHYLEPEKRGQESFYRLFVSGDMADSWKREKSTIDTVQNALSASSQLVYSSGTYFTTAPQFCSKKVQIDLGKDSIYLCQGTSVSLDAGFFYKGSYLWSSDSGNSDTRMIRLSKPGKYNISVTDRRGCAGNDSVYSFSAPGVKADFSVLANYCHHDTLKAINRSIPLGNAVYTWNTSGLKSDTVSRDVVSVPSQPGSYKIGLLAVNIYGCKDSITKNVRVFPLPASNFSVKDTCPQHSLVFANQTIIMQNLPFSTSVSSYLWELGDGSRYKWNAKSPLLSTIPPLHTYPSYGNYTIKLIATNNIGCSDSVIIPVTLIYTPERDSLCYLLNTRLDLGPDRFICHQGSAIELDAGKADSYVWYYENGFFSSSRQVKIEKPGNYWAIAKKGPIVTSDTVLVKVSPEAVTASYLVASGASTGEEIQVIQLADPKPERYSWTFGDGASDTLFSPVHTYYAEGDYSITLIARNDYCSDTLTKEITIVPARLENMTNVQAFFKTIELFPNPATEALKLKADGLDETLLDITLFSAAGKQYQLSARGSGNQLYELQLGDLPEGLYIIRVNHPAFVGRGKFIKSAAGL